MDDDVKNLFQKFGHTTNSYQEINRDIDSEQAKLRWPLLRDVRVSEVPEHFSHDADEVSFESAAHLENAPASATPKSPFLKIRPAPTVAALPENDDVEQNTPVFDTPVPSPNAVKKVVTNRSTFAANSRATEPAQTVNLFQKEQREFDKEMSTAIPVVNKLYSNDGLFRATSMAPVGEMRSSQPSKANSVTDVFKRLLNQDQPAPSNESPVNSFFKKIFRP